MSSFSDCVSRELDKRVKNPKTKKAILERYNKLVDANENRGLARADAERAAEQAIVEQAEFELVSKQKVVIKQAQAQERLFKELENFLNRNGEVDPAGAMERLIEDFSREGGQSNFAVRQSTVRSYLQSNMDRFMEKYSLRKAGFERPTEGLDNVVAEMHGRDTGDTAAKQVAEALADTFEKARLRANRAGANIPKREIWGMPHNHSTSAVRAAGKDGWIAFVKDRIDWNKMKDFETGGEILDKDAFLQGVWETISTYGAVKLTPGEFRGKGALATRMHQQRVLEFKDDKAWMQYHEQFGEGDIFSLVMNHTSMMARDITMMEIFGPNPAAMKRALEDKALKMAADIDIKTPPAKQKRKSNVDRVQKQIGGFTDMFEQMNGTHGLIPGDFAGETLATLRNIITGSALGSTVLIAIPTDVMFKTFIRLTSGLPAGKFLRNYASQFVSKASQAEAVRFGLVNDSMATVAYAQQRMFGDVTGYQFGRRFADTALRLAMLNTHTQAARNAAMLETFGGMTDYRGKAFNELPSLFRTLMERNNITPKDWDMLRKGRRFKFKNGSEFLYPNGLRGTPEGEEVADKFMDMIYTQSQFQVPSNSIKARSTLISSTQPGTFPGEVLRSGAQFKNFAFTIGFTYGRETLVQKGLDRKIAFGLSFLLATTFAGAVGTQIREVAKGRDPMNMDPRTSDGRKFWGASLLSGGGLAIFGDFLFNNVNRYGGSLGETIGGPAIGFLSDLKNLTVGNFEQLWEGEDTNFGKEMLNFAYRHLIPKPFYARLAMERMVVDQLQKAADPRASQRFRRMMRGRKRDYGQDYFWKPGKSLPDRLPEYSQ
jgi:hypothetical protein